MLQDKHFINFTTGKDVHSACKSCGAALFKRPGGDAAPIYVLSTQVFASVSRRTNDRTNENRNRFVGGILIRCLCDIAGRQVEDSRVVGRAGQPVLREPRG